MVKSQTQPLPEIVPSPCLLREERREGFFFPLASSVLEKKKPDRRLTEQCMKHLRVFQ